MPENNLRHAADTGRAEAAGWRVRRNGEVFWAHVIIEQVLDVHGALPGFAKVTRDVTERREATERLEQAREDLFQSKKMEAIGQIASGVAHDFNHLLMAVLGNLEMLQEMLPPQDARASAVLGNAVAGAQRGAALTQRMLAFACLVPTAPTRTSRWSIATTRSARWRSKRI